MTQEFSQMLITAGRVACQAGDYARQSQSQASAEFKPDDQIVTQVDRQCQEMIIAALSSAFPEHGYIAEEGVNGELFKQPPQSGCDIWWVIDPIDGTRNYAHGASQYAVSIGALKGNQPIIGAVYDPITRQLYSAGRGTGATCNDRPIRCANRPLTRNTQFGIASSFPTKFNQAMLKLHHEQTCMNLGSAALHFAYVAAGHFDGAFAWEVRLWDVAAGIVLTEAAGGTASDLNGRALQLDCQSYDGGPIEILLAPRDMWEYLLSCFASDRTDNA